MTKPHADIGIIGGTGVYDPEIIENAEKLKVIGRHGVGYDNIDVKVAIEKKKPVTYTPGANSISVAEHTIGLMFALAKKLMLLDRATRIGEWEARDRYEGIELDDKICGLVGLGRVGTEVARLLKAINIQVLYFDAVRKMEIEEKLGRLDETIVNISLI